MLSVRTGILYQTYDYQNISFVSIFWVDSFQYEMNISPKVRLKSISQAIDSDEPFQCTSYDGD